MARDSRTNVIISAVTKGFAEALNQATRLNEAVTKATTAQASGFAQAQDAATKFQKTTGEALKGLGTQAVKKEIEELIESFAGLEDLSVEEFSEQVEKLEGDLNKLGKQQMLLTKSMENMKEGSKEYRVAELGMRKLGEETARTQKRMHDLNRTFTKQRDELRKLKADQRSARGSLAQGLLQGIAPGGAGFLQRGPGMRRQFMGQMVGSTVGGVARAGMGGAFRGLGGIQQGLAANPLLSMVGGQLGSAMGLAGGALQFQRQQVALAPFLAGGGAGAGINAARRRGAAQFEPGRARMSEDFIAGEAAKATAAEAGRFQMTDEIRQRIDDEVDEQRESFTRTLANRRGLLPQLEAGGIGGRAVRKLVERDAEKQLRDIQTKAIFTDERDKAAGIAGDQVRKQLETHNRKIDDDRAAAGGKAAAAARRRLGFGDLGRAGRQFGFSRQEAMQEAGGIAQAGGGTLAEMQQQGMLRTGLAMRRMGVDAGTIGSFQQAGRQGGIQGQAGAVMTRAFADAVEMGLKGSEVVTYLQEMSAGIQQWQQTGIPLASQSIGEMGKNFAGLGLGGLRGQRVGAGVVQAAQGLSRTGPQSAADLMMFQGLGGFQGGGAAEFEKAQLQLENLDKLKPKELTKRVNDLMRNFMGAGTGGDTLDPDARARGRGVLRSALGKRGIQLGIGETQLLDKRLRGEDLDDDDKKKIKEIEAKFAEGTKAAPKNMAELQKQAAEMISAFGGNLRSAADNQNKQLEVGKKLVTTMTNLERTTLNTQQAFTKLVGGEDGVLTKTTKMMADLTSALPAVVDDLKRIKDEGLLSFSAFGN